MGENFKLPNGWVLARAKHIGFIINGDRGKNYPSRRHYIEAGIPFISAGNLSDGRLSKDSFNYISEEKYNALNNGKLLKGDIIYCLRGTLGKCAIFNIPGKAAIASSLAILRLNKMVDRNYVRYFLQSPYGMELIKRFDNGTAQPNLSANSFADYEIPLPPFPEQHRIVTKIEELFSSLDKGIETLKTAQQQLKVYRQAVLKWAFEGKLTNENVVDGELPVGWKWVAFSELIATSQNGISKRTGKEGPECKVLRLSDISLLSIDYKSPRYIKLTKDEAHKYQLFKGDLVCIRVNGSIDLVGRLILIREIDDLNDWAFCDHFIRFSLEKEVAFSHFYYFYFQLIAVRNHIQENMVSSAGQNTVSQGTVKSVMVPLPPFLEQQTIVAEIESRLSVCDKIEESIEHSLKQAETLRQSILKKAFEGKLVSQDPNDEPASVLLARIKAERERNKPEVHQPRKTGRTKKSIDASLAKAIKETGE
jgi:type I restriction enzyme S subunit